jgi:hypothetical protein
MKATLQHRVDNPARERSNQAPECLRDLLIEKEINQSSDAMIWEGSPVFSPMCDRDRLRHGNGLNAQDLGRRR